MPPSNWTDQSEKEFLIHLIMFGGTSRKAMTQIASMMGAPHTPGSLSTKLSRLKQEYKKNWPEIDGIVATAKAGHAEDNGVADMDKVKSAKPKTGANNKRKKAAADDAKDGEREESAVEAKSKDKRGRKAKFQSETEPQVKDEPEEETEDEVEV